jgi:hypothetical protein
MGHPAGMSKVTRLYQDSEEGRKRIEHHEKILISKDWQLFLILFGLRVRVVQLEHDNCCLVSRASGFANSRMENLRNWLGAWPPVSGK